jgi:hypothetical protein
VPREDHALEEVDKPLADLQDQVQEDLLGMDNVVGVGVGRRVESGRSTGEPCLSVFVSRKLPYDALHPDVRVPSTIRRCRTDVVEIGEITAGYEPAPRPSARRRPTRGGASVAHVNGPAGTIGAGVIDSEQTGTIPRYYVLGNNHTLARMNEAALGDPILQPAPSDGGCAPLDTIGHLSRFVPIAFDGSPNLIDAALAEATFDDLDRSVFWIGHAREPSLRVRVGQTAQKTGRTSNFTLGNVRAVNVTLRVHYPGKVARFERQIMLSKMCAAGDGGSLVFDGAARPLGLLFAASEFATIANPISFVQSLLNVLVAF